MKEKKGRAMKSIVQYINNSVPAGYPVVNWGEE